MNADAPPLSSLHVLSMQSKEANAIWVVAAHLAACNGSTVHCQAKLTGRRAAGFDYAAAALVPPCLSVMLP